MDNSITNRQIFFILLLTLTSYSLVGISKAMAESAGTGSWITILITSIFFGLAAIVIVSLNNMFKGKMLLDYATQLVGKPIGYCIAIYYIMYFLLIGVLLVISMGKLLKVDFFPKTPIWAIIMIGIPLFSYIAYKGINTIARLFEFFGLIFIITAVTVHILMITQGEVERILPLFNSSDMGNYLKAIKQAIFPFLGIEVLLIMPLSKKNGRKGIRTAFLSIISIGLFYILVIESCIMKIGINDIVNYNDSLIEAIRDISLPFLGFLERVDILFLTVGFWGIYLGISIVFTAIVEYLCKIFSRRSRLTIVIIVGIVIFILSLIANGILGFEEFVIETGTFLGMISCIIIPVILMIIAKVKKYGS